MASIISYIQMFGPQLVDVFGKDRVVLPCKRGCVIGNEPCGFKSPQHFHMALFLMSDHAYGSYVSSQLLLQHNAPIYFCPDHGVLSGQ